MYLKKKKQLVEFFLFLNTQPQPQTSKQSDDHTEETLGQQLKAVTSLLPSLSWCLRYTQQ